VSANEQFDIYPKHPHILHLKCITLERLQSTLIIHSSLLEANPDAPTIAASLDAERISGHIRGPLHGIPFMVKDNIATKDKMQTTAGSWALLGAVVPRDAFVVSKLRDAGAVLLGKATLSEWADMRSNNYSEGYSARAVNPEVLIISPLIRAAAAQAVGWELPRTWLHLRWEQKRTAVSSTQRKGTRLWGLSQRSAGLRERASFPRVHIRTLLGLLRGQSVMLPMLSMQYGASILEIIIHWRSKGKVQHGLEASLLSLPKISAEARDFRHPMGVLLDLRRSGTADNAP